jgi:hypothetical protein
MNEADRKFTERAFAVMFTLGFIYMGALSAALEGWDRTFTVLSWLGLAVMVGSLIACCRSLFTSE